MKRAYRAISVVTLFCGLGFSLCRAAEYKSGIPWPEPPLVDPGPPGPPILPPSDAIVLFDGHDLSAWEGGENWRIEDGVATSHGGGIQTKQSFGDCQLHVEWATPEEVSGEGQGRGNSGVYLQGHYEIQVLDSHNNPTYFDGQAGSLYKQSPPLVNVSRKPGEWQTYDIVFHGPRFNAEGNLIKPGHVTVFHNNVLVQDNTEIQGTTAWDRAPKYEPHPDKLPLQLQFHGNPVKYRSVWIRELTPRETPSAQPAEQQPADEPPAAEAPASEPPAEETPAAEAPAEPEPAEPAAE